MSDVSIQDVVGQTRGLSIGDKTYTLTSVTMESLSELEKWVQSQPLIAFEAMVKQLGQTLLPEERKRYLMDAIERSRSIRIWGPDDEMAPEIKSVVGIRELLYLTIRQSHPEITREEVAKFPADKINSVRGTLSELSGFVGRLGKDGEPESKTPA